MNYHPLSLSNPLGVQYLDIQFMFKTLDKEGVLLYSGGASKNRLIVELYAGEMQINVAGG